MPNNADYSDHELIAAAQRGERDAMDIFVRRHGGWVRHVVYAALGDASVLDDVVQHVWTTVWQQISSLVDSRKWRGWFCTLARNAAIDAGQKVARDRRRCVSGEGLISAAASNSDPARRVAGEEEHRRIMDAIRGLPAIYREPFMLRHTEDWSYAQIGETLGLPVATVETRLVRARRLLRTALREMNAKPNGERRLEKRIDDSNGDYVAEMVETR